METGYGICNLSVVPCRAEPSDKSEMITQLLFGEHFSIIRSQGNWLYIRSAHDAYESWVDVKQIQTISAESYEELEARPAPCTLDLLGVAEDTEKGLLFPLSLGSFLPYFENGTCNLEGYEYVREAKRVELDGRRFSIKSDGKPLGMFGPQYYEFILIPMDE
jgi:hypothetical protein